MSGSSAGTLSVTITGIDRLSSVFQRITGTADRFGKRMSSVGDRLHRGLALDRLTRGAQGASRALSAMVPAIGVLTAAGTLAGIGRLVSGFATFGAQLGRDASRIRTTVADLAALQGAARLAGSSAADLTSGMIGLGDAVVDAVGGRDDTAVMYLRMLGINMRDASGNARTAADILPEVADGIARIANPALQARVMSALRLPAGMLPFLRDGAAGIEQYRREVARLNPMQEAGAQAARRFEMAFARLGLASEGIGNMIAARLEPVLIPLLNHLTEWLATSGPGFADMVGRIAESFAKWVDSGGLDRLGTAIQGIFTGIGRVVDAMGGWENAAIGLGVVLTANLLAPLVRITAALGTIAAFRVPPWILRLLPLAFVGPAGGEDQEFSRRRNEEWLRDHPRDPNTPAPERPQAPVINQFFNSIGRTIERMFSPRGGDRSVQGGSAVPQTPIAPGSPEQQERIRRMGGDLMREFSLTREQAAGIVGNGLTESGLAAINERNPIIPGSRGGYGYFQWTGPRRRAFEAWAADRGLDITSHEANSGFLMHELRNLPEGRAALDRVRQTNTAPDAAQQFFPFLSGGDPRAIPNWGARLGNAARADGVMAAPTAPTATTPAAGGTSRMDVRITLAGPGSEGATITSRTDDGGVRIQRPSLGLTP